MVKKGKRKVESSPPESDFDEPFDVSDDSGSGVDETPARGSGKDVKKKALSRRSKPLRNSRVDWPGDEEVSEEESVAREAPAAAEKPRPPPPGKKTPAAPASASGGGNDGGSDSDTAASLGLTSDEIVSLYTNCIRLASESKINSRNAFQLQLIDVMGIMIRTQEKTGGGANKFQYASCALDASAKIYAVRVDTVHTDTLNVAGTMHRLDKEQKRKGGDEEPEFDEDGNPVPVEDNGPKTRRRRKNMGSSLEKNKENLLVTERDLVNDVPTHGRIQIDEGRVGVGVFMARAKPADDSLSLQLQETSKYVFSRFKSEEDVKRKEAAAERLKKEGFTLDLDGVMEAVGDLSGDVPILNEPDYDDFKWGDDDGDGTLVDGGGLDDSMDASGAEYRFDVNKPMEAALPDAEDAVPFDMDLEEPFDVDVGDDGAGALDEADASFHRDRHAFDPGLVDDPSSMAVMRPDYSYFDKELVRVWSGADRWKHLARIRKNPRLAAIAAGLPQQQQAQPKRKRKKDEFSIPDWDWDKTRAENMDDIAEHFMTTRLATEVSDRTIATWTEAKTTLPVDHKMDSRMYFSYFGLDRDFTLDLQPHASGEHGGAVEDEDEDYDYENPNDASYCAPPVENPNGLGPGSGADAEDGDGVFEAAHEDQGEMFEFAAAANAGALVGDNLIAAPLSVPTLDIGYARTAKRIDMRRLKGTIWALLTREENDRLVAEYKTERGSEGLDETVDAESIPGLGESMGSTVMKLSELYYHLPKHLPKQMADDLTVHLALVAVLHIVNEKGLKLTSIGDCEDFEIRAGAEEVELDQELS